MPRTKLPWLLIALIVLGAGVWYTQPGVPHPVDAPVAPASTSPTSAPATAVSSPPTLAPTRPPLTGVAAQVYRIDPTQSEASYRVRETFFDGRGLFTAVGVSQGISGDILIDRANPAGSRVGEVVVDLKPLRTDDPDRDRAIRDGYLETGKYPVARFANVVIQDLPASLNEGQPFAFKLEGDLTVRAFTHRVMWDAEALVDGDRLTATATTKVTLTQFGIQVPNLRILRAEDEATLVIRLVAQTVGPSATATPAPTALTCAPSRGNPNASRPFDTAPRSSAGVGHVLAGVVRSAAGCTPLANARLFFWLANPDGKYEEAYQATVVADDRGAYRFESIFPGVYEGAPPHIHIFIEAEGHQSIEYTLAVDKNNPTRQLDLVVTPR